MSVLVASVACLSPAASHASCNQIPGTSNSFRGALGSIDRPFAGPGDIVELRLSESCDAASPGFQLLSMAHVVTVVFTPPQGPRNVVVLSSNCAGLAGQIASCNDRPNVGTVTCSQVNLQDDSQALRVITEGEERRLRFRFPDTDALLGEADDDHTLTGPATVAVSLIGDTIPCGLIEETCDDQTGLVACVGRLFATNGTCNSSRPETFKHFSALPPPNNYQAVCVAPSPPCTGSASEVRLTVDTEGNLLIPMDWRGVLLGQGVTIARLVRGTSDVEAFPGFEDPVQLPDQSLLSSFSSAGSKLPPIFEPQLDPAEPDRLTLFGTVDAPETVLRVSRLNSAAPAICAGGENDGNACNAADDCPDGSCPAVEPLFDFSTRLRDGVGPVLVSAANYDLRAQDPVPLDGLVQTNDLFAFVVPEAAGEGGGAAGEGEDEPRDLNQDGDIRDEVFLLMDRRTGVVKAIGAEAAPGRAVTRVRRPPFSFPAIDAAGEIAAFLETEPGQGNRDSNDDGDVSDSILRVFRLEGAGAVSEVTVGMDLTVDPAPMLNDQTLVVSGSKVFFRGAEASSAPRVTELVSVASDGTQAIDPSIAYRPALSADGSIVAFQTQAPNLLVRPERDTNGRSDVFVHDRRTGTTERVSVDSDGGEANALSGGPSLTADGEVVAFHSDAELDLNDVGAGSRDVFLRDRSIGVTSLLASGRREPSLSADGLVVAVLNNDANPSVFVNETPGSSTKVGRKAFQASLSADGQVVAFDSDAVDLVPDDTNFSTDIFVRNRSAAAPVLPERVSVSSSGEQANAASRSPSVSGDGRFVVFESNADNLVAGDTNGVTDVFVHDRATGLTERISVAADGTQGDGASQIPRFANRAVSDDGRFVAFESFARNLVPFDGNAAADIFVHDRLTGMTERVSVATQGGGADDGSRGAPFALSADGLTVAFESASSDLVDADENEASDLFVRGPQLLAEEDDVRDLSGDGDLADTVLQVVDADTGSVLNLGPATQVVVSGESAAFLRPEGAANPVGVTITGPPLDLPLAVPDGGGATASFMDVAAPGRITDVNLIGLHISHTFAPDLVLALTSPSGTTVALSLNRGVFGADYLNTSFDDEATLPIGVGVAPMTGSFRPEERLSSFDGETAIGPWILTVRDGVPVSPPDFGFVESWQLEITAVVEEDLNGDGDTEDDVVQLYSGGTEVENLGSAATSLALSDNWLAALVSEDGQRDTDLNADFDRNDRVVAVYDRQLGAWANLGQAADSLELSGALVVFTRPEAAKGVAGTDLNGDGDATDRVLELYDAATQQRVPVVDRLNRSQVAEDFVLGPTVCQGGSSDGVSCAGASGCPDGGWCAPTLVAFRSDEAAAGRDLNGNPATDVDVMQIYDVRRRVLINTGQAVTPCRLEACDPSVPYRVAKDTVTFLTLESEQNEDLNNDGDLGDLILQTFNVPNADGGLIRAAAGAGGGAFSRTVQRGGGVSAGPATTVGSVSAGVCTNSGTPCVDDGDCAAGECFVPPGGCVKDLGVSCVPPTTAGAPSPCDDGQFCGPVPGAAGSFRCMQVVGPCRSDASCDAIEACTGADCRCNDAGQTLVRFIAPLSTLDDGGQVFISAGDGRCLAPTAHTCGEGIDCPNGQICVDGDVCERDLGPCGSNDQCDAGATCRQELVVAAAVDSDGDELTDPFDNCPSVSNVEQADTNGDGVGDACASEEDTPMPTATETSDVPATPTPTGSDGTATPTMRATETPTEPTPLPTSTQAVPPTDTPTLPPTDTPTVAATPTSTASSTSTPTDTPTMPCVGDCAEDGSVTIDDLVTGVAIALGTTEAAECPSFDCNDEGVVSIDCLVQGVNAAMRGSCS